MITVSLEKARAIALEQAELAADDQKRAELQSAIQQAGSIEQLKAIVDAIKDAQ